MCVYGVGLCVRACVSWEVSRLLTYTVGVTSGSPSHPSVWRHLKVTMMLKLLPAANTGFKGSCWAERAGECQVSCPYIKFTVSRNKETLNLEHGKCSAASFEENVSSAHQFASRGGAGECVWGWGAEHAIAVALR